MLHPLKWILSLLAFLLVLALVIGSLTKDGPISNNERIISESEYGNDWPFTVRQGRLKCTDSAVTFEADGTTYAVNGTAQSRGYPRIDSIWKHGVTTPRISISSVLHDGLVLC